MDVGLTADTTIRIGDDGHYSASSSFFGLHPETAGTYTVTAPDTITTTSPEGSRTYRYHLEGNDLTLQSTINKHDETCNLTRQNS